MYKKCVCLIFLVFLLGMVGNASAVDRNWTNTNGNCLWSTAANWSGSVVPTSTDKAGIRNQAILGPIIQSGIAAVANQIVVGDFSSTNDTLDMTGGTLTTSGTSCWVVLGYGATNNGTFTMSGGTATFGNNFYVGRSGTGTLNMTGGSITVTTIFGIVQNAGGTGHVYLDGGTINANGTFTMISGASLDITTGTLIVNGDVTSTINTYKTNGWITAYDGTGTVNVSYNTPNAGKTTVTASSGGLPGQAANPNPVNGATGVAITATLSWTAGSGATSHDVYFGTTSPGALIGNQAAATYNPGTLAYGTTYYWRIDEKNANGTTTGVVWSFTTTAGGSLPAQATTPGPANSATGVSITNDLSWSAGSGATSHDVYFGTTSPGILRGNQTATTYDTGTMTNGTTYYWRIDEKNASGTTTGVVWSFTTAGAAQANLRKGPYLIYPGVNTQMTVLWQIDAAAGCTIAWGVDTNYSSGSANTSEYGSDHQHKYNITGLTPGTKYFYRVTVGANNYTGNFYAAPAATATNVKFFMYGDTRTNGNSNNSLCGQMISAYNADPAYQTMVLHAGDWVNADDEATWTSEWYNYTWTNIANATANMPFMGTIGNHEGNGSCPVFEKYRPFPYVAAPANYFSFDYGPVHVAVVDQYTTYTSGSAQYNWLVNDLSTSTKPWKIIVLHQPGWCAGGTHGNDATVQTVIQPLCVTYGVQIVLAGHNHYYSRAVNNGVHHVASGSGGAPYYSASSGQPYVVTYTVNTLECVKIAIAGNTLTGTTVSSSGSVIDTFTINGSAPSPPGQAANPSPANSAANVSTSANLSWSAGSGATSRDVYFGTTSPGTSRGNQTATTYDTGTMANSKTYYWRIDEKNANGTTTGVVWSFTTTASGLPDLTFVQATDMQMGYRQCGNMDYLWGTTISKINNINPAFVIVTGDLLNTSSSTVQRDTYRSYAAGINPGIPIYTLPGNHDISEPPTLTKYNWWLANLAYPSGYANPWYSFTYGDSIFICLESGVLRSPGGSGLAGKNTEQINWLTSTLINADAAGYAHKFVFMHIPLCTSSVGEAYGGSTGWNMPIAVRQQLLGLFHQYGVEAVFAGHYHRNAYVLDGDLEIITTASCTCGLGSPPAAPGIRIIKVYPDRIEQESRTLDSLP
jgi:phosphodiesterase/alkaline phosphatase D-like protein